MPRQAPPLRAIASRTIWLSRPYTVALTNTARSMPSFASSARSASKGASGGVYGRSGE
jgi:hypothetical protein